MKTPHQPIRMCISCRTRAPQRELMRLKLVENELFAYDGIGRSLYLCSECRKNQKKLKGIIKRFRLDEASFVNLLEELTKNG